MAGGGRDGRRHLNGRHPGVEVIEPGREQVADNVVDGEAGVPVQGRSSARVVRGVRLAAVSDELADVLDCSRRTVLNKLHTLEEQGDVASKKVGGRSKVWWVPLPADSADR